MSVARANIPSTKDTVSLPVFQSREGFVKAEGAVTNWFVNGVSVQTYASSSYNAGGIVPVADFLNGYINMTASGTLTSPSAVDIYNYLVGARLNLSTPTAGAPGTAVAGAAPSCYVVIYNSSAGLAKLAAGAGVSISPNPLDIGPGNVACVQIFVTSSTAVTLLPLSSGGTAANEKYYLLANPPGAGVSQTVLKDGQYYAIAGYTATVESLTSSWTPATATFVAPRTAYYRFKAKVRYEPTSGGLDTGYDVGVAIRQNGTVPKLFWRDSFATAVSGDPTTLPQAFRWIFLEGVFQATASQPYQFMVVNFPLSSGTIDLDAAPPSEFFEIEEL